MDLASSKLSPIPIRKQKVKLEKDNKNEENSILSLSSSSSSNDEAEKGEAEIRQEQEHKSNLVAHFYKFQEESGNPENIAPQLGGNDVDIYRFYTVVKRMGGHRSVTKENKWPIVLRKLKLDLSKGEVVDASQVRKTYLSYFEKFESFMNKLGNSSLLVAASSSTSTSQRNTRIVRTIATPIQPGDARTSKRSRGGKSSSSVRGESSCGTLSRSRSSSVKDNSPAFSVGTKSSAKSSKKSSEEPQELQLTQHSFSSFSTFSSSTFQHFESPSSHKRSLSFNIEKEKAASKFLKKSSPSTLKFTGNEDKTDKNIVVKHDFTGSELKNHQPVHPIKSYESVNPVKLILSPSEKLKKTLSSSITSPTISSNLEASENLKKTSIDAGIVSEGGPQQLINIIKKPSSPGKETISSPFKQIKIPQQRGRKPKHAIFQQLLPSDGVEIGYSNAHIFTRFYQGQKVNARHHLRFYDARVITVKQPSLLDIAKSLNNAFALSRITHQSSPELKTLTLENMGSELKDALRNLMNSTKIFVHYLGWNSRYDVEWLMLHKIRVDEKDERLSAQQVENHLIKSNNDYNLPPQLLAVALDWCNSSEGIPSLTSLPSAQSSEQRPRRLSASALAKTTNITCTSESISNNVVSRRQSYSTTVTSSTMDYRSPLNPFSSHHSPTTSTCSLFNDVLPFTAPLPNNTIGHSFGKFTIPHLPIIPLPPSISDSSSTSIPISISNNTQHLPYNDYKIKEEEQNECNKQQKQILSPIKNNTSIFKTNVKTIISSTTGNNLIDNLNINSQLTTTESINNNIYLINTTTTTNTTTNSSSSIPIIFPISSTTLQQNKFKKQKLVISCEDSDNDNFCSSSSLGEEKLNDSETCMKLCFTNVKEENEGDDLFRLSPPPVPPILITKEKEENCQNNFHFKKDENKAKAKITLSVNVSTSTAFDVTPIKNSNNSTTSPFSQQSTWVPKKRKSGESIVGSSPSKISRNNLKSPVRPTNNCTSSNSINALISSNRSPIIGLNETTSDEEENTFEEVHRSLHCLRQRLLHKMEAEHLFDNHDFLGLSNLDEMLEKCADDTDKQVQILEQRMRELHSIYHEYKGKLNELEKQNRRRRKKEQLTNATRSIIAENNL